jgi:hypothetical protein
MPPVSKAAASTRTDRMQKIAVATLFVVNQNNKERRLD